MSSPTDPQLVATREPEGDGRGAAAARAVAVPLLALAAAAVVLVQSRAFDGIAGTYPRLVGVATAAVALVALAIQVRASVQQAPAAPPASGSPAAESDQPADEERGGERIRLLPMLAFFALMAVAVGLIEPFGFVMVSGVFIAAAMVLLGARSWWRVATYAVLAPAVFHVLFERLLLLRLPVGPWGW